MPVETRSIVQRFEWERMLADDGVNREYFGVRYADAINRFAYRSGERPFDQVFAEMTVPQQTIYTLAYFAGQVSNGGISQFFFNAPPHVRDAVHDAMMRIEATDTWARCATLFAVWQRKGELQSIRDRRPPTWDDFLEAKSGLGEEAGRFDAWFFDGQQTQLDVLARQYVRAHEDELVIFCDGNPQAQIVWKLNILTGLLMQYTGYLNAQKTGSPWVFFDHLFEPASRDRLGSSKEAQRQVAKHEFHNIAAALTKACRQPDLAQVVDGTPPSTRVTRRSWWRRRQDIVLVHCEPNDMDMGWFVRFEESAA